MRVIFIRHGETTGDVEDRYGGVYDDRLSIEGMTQALELADELREKGIEEIVTSGLVRAQETGAVLAGRLKVGLKIDGRLSERNQYGPLTGMLKAEARKTFPEIVELVKDRLFTLPGAESYEEFRVRVVAGFEALPDDGKVRAVVWHGGGMRVLFRDILKWGELRTLGDCCWVELAMRGGTWEMVDSRRLEFAYDA